MSQKALADHYADDFYDWQRDGSFKSAGRYAELLAAVYQPRSVVDVGCGRGTWLKAFRQAGTERVVGFDGPWNSQDKMVDESIRFFGIDLNRPTNLTGERFDMAMSLEVAEHLEPTSAVAFVAFMTDLSDVVLFGAAFSGQGGINHINEQPHSYWAEKFVARGYVPFDLFRPVVWGEPGIEVWYKQNTYLYVRNGSPLHQSLIAKGHSPITNLQFMNGVHPDLFASKLIPMTSGEMVKELAARAIPKKVRPAIKRALGMR
jgi:SAM-dependent methyltransferase